MLRHCSMKSANAAHACSSVSCQTRLIFCKLLRKISCLSVEIVLATQSHNRFTFDGLSQWESYVTTNSMPFSEKNCVQASIRLSEVCFSASAALLVNTPIILG